MNIRFHNELNHILAKVCVWYVRCVSEEALSMASCVKCTRCLDLISELMQVHFFYVCLR